MGWAERGRWLGDWPVVAELFGWMFLVRGENGEKMAYHFHPEAADYKIPVIPGLESRLAPPLIVVRAGPYVWFFNGDNYPGI